MAAPSSLKSAARAPRRPAYHHTGPDTVAGRYLRSFWQPVHHAADLPAGRAKPIKIMNEEFTLYRGTGGEPHLTEFRCPHRGTQLSIGEVAGDSIACIYHGWKFDAAGQCVAQPAEPKPFAKKVRLKTYPCREYLGLIFAYLGAGAPPEFPTYPQFEQFEGVLELDSYFRACNYFNNLENGGDLAHSGFLHRDVQGAFDGYVSSPVMDGQESIWGVTIIARWPNQTRLAQFGMPNIAHIKVQPTDPSIAIYREFIAWWVPVDDASHFQFTVVRVLLPQDKLRLYLDRRGPRLAKRVHSSVALAAKVLKGELYRQDVVPETTDYVRFQDDIAQVGQGVIADHFCERLGQSDKAVILIRKLWTRELNALAKGQPLKHWRYDAAALPVSRGEMWEKRFTDQVHAPQPAAPGE